MAAGWRVRAATALDDPAMAAFLADQDSSMVARQGRLEDVSAAPKLVVEHDGAIVGVLSYLVVGSDCEVLTLHATRQWSGIGTALLAAVEQVALDLGSRRLWLVTTNDNTDALRFYQRRGFRLLRVDPGAVDRSRTSLKPSIPEVGLYGIRLRDELVLERAIVPAPQEASRR
jgi:N-acetylglutamate synthase-like GNAT family acetyltransferase